MEYEGNMANLKSVSSLIESIFSNVGYWPRGLLFRSKSHRAFLDELGSYAVSGGKCLDLGCGTVHRYKPLIEALGMEWYGADILRQDGLKGKYRQVIDYKIEFEDGFFDMISAFNVIEHFTDPEAMFGEIRRCLKDGGVFCGACAFWEMEHDSYFHYTSLGLTEILKRHGFEVISIKPSEYSGMVLRSQRFFGGGGTINRETWKSYLKTMTLCTLNWVPFLAVNILEIIKKAFFSRFNDPFKDCATLYFFARKLPN